MNSLQVLCTLQWNPCHCGCDGFNLRVGSCTYWAYMADGNYTIYSGHSANGAFVGYRPTLDEAAQACELDAARRDV